ncbi:MAG: c-type cytochrome [Pseudomonadota bacterium]
MGLMVRVALIVLSAVGLNGAAWGESVGETLISGQEEYHWNCAACHGEDAKGGGPLAAALVKQPSDLTLIASRNGGAFPAVVVYETIAGRKDVQGHQSFQMPRYWNRFTQAESHRGYDLADVRIKAIVQYLETVQAR